MGEWVTVSKETFFATVGQLNVHPRTERERTFWERPNREVVGVTTPGYLAEGERTYSISTVIAFNGGPDAH